ncbi:Chemotaxis response regulator protein-glutamate methylesterase (fragment) [Nitrospira japonica]|uniref:protein-glutamate methylesterase n=1 Tax=Nitrospira japonica TaxID=1325564 RepID=A0A1W1I539_9BACT
MTDQASSRRNVIVIGASLGGVNALQYLCANLPSDLPATVGVVIHRSPWWVSNIPAIYGRTPGGIRVQEAQAHDVLKEGVVYFAPADHHMQFGKGVIQLTRGPKLHFTRPAADALFISAAKTFGDRVIGVVLTGGGADGAHGLIAIKASGGVSVVQDPKEAVDPSMPVNGIRMDSVDHVTPLAELPKLLWCLTTEVAEKRL